MSEEKDETTTPPQDNQPTAPLKQDFTVKLQRKPGKPEERITLFTYVNGESLGHFPCIKGDTFSKTFTDLSLAKAFIDGALDSGGFTIAFDSPVKAKAQ